MWRGCSVALFPKPFKMKLDGLAHGFFNTRTSTARGNATGKVWGVCRVACLGLFDNDEVSHGFNPACLNILLSVPGAKSDPGFPAIVTSPGFLSCLNWR